MRAMRYAAVMATALTLMCAVPAIAQGTVDEKTQLTFSEAVMVPGATLQPGTYTFQIVNSDDTQQLVQILDQTGAVKATMTTVPLRREASQVKGDTVLKFSPTTGGASAPVALKGWFYPGMMYGHEFVYPDEQARDIAQRTKTVVLAADAQKGDGQVGRIYTYDASGRRAPWTNEATVRTAPAANEPAANTPMMQGDRAGMRVKVNALEGSPTQYIGKTVSVDAEVDEVLGPRLFKIDEPNWADLDAEVLVYVPTNLAALVQRGDRVTVTGVVKPFARAEIERDFDWIDPMPDLDVSFATRPVIVASRVVGGNNNVVMTIEVAPDVSNRAVGTSGNTAGTTTRGAAITDVRTLAMADNQMVGRNVDLNGAQVTGRAAHGHGFWVRGQEGRSVFVLPAHPGTVRPDQDTTVSISGVVLEMPRSMREQFTSTANFNDDVYVYAAKITR